MRRRVRLTWGRALEALVLVRLGQELGSTSPLARAVHDLLVAVVGLVN